MKKVLFCILYLHPGYFFCNKGKGINFYNKKFIIGGVSVILVTSLLFLYKKMKGNENIKNEELQNYLVSFDPNGDYTESKIKKIEAFQKIFIENLISIKKKLKEEELKNRNLNFKDEDVIKFLILFTIPFKRFDYKEFSLYQNSHLGENILYDIYFYSDYLLSNKNELIIKDVDYILNFFKNKKKIFPIDIKEEIKKFHFQYVYNDFKEVEDANKYYINRISPETYNIFVKTFFAAKKKKKLIYFFKNIFEASDKCFPFQRRNLIDNYYNFSDEVLNNTLSFYDIFKDDKNFNNVIINKYKILEIIRGGYIDENSFIQEIKNDFINDVIKAEKEGNLESGYSNNTLWKKNCNNKIYCRINFGFNKEICFNVDAEKKMICENKKENEFSDQIKNIIDNYLELDKFSLEKKEGFQNKEMIKTYIKNNKDKDYFKNLNKEDFKKKIYKNFKLKENNTKNNELDIIFNELKVFSNQNI